MEDPGILFCPDFCHFAGAFWCMSFLLCAQLEDDDVFLTERELKILIARVTTAEVVIVNLAFDVSHVGGAVASALVRRCGVGFVWPIFFCPRAEDYTLVTEAAFLSDVEIGHDADFRQLRLFVAAVASALHFAKLFQ